MKALIQLREKELVRKEKESEEANERLNMQQEENEDMRRRVQALEQAVVVKKNQNIM